MFEDIWGKGIFSKNSHAAEEKRAQIHLAMNNNALGLPVRAIDKIRHNIYYTK